MENKIDYKSVLELLKEATFEEDKTFTLVTEKYFYIIKCIFKNKKYFNNKFFLDDDITLTIKINNREYYYYFKIDDIISYLTEEEMAQYDLYMLLLNNNKHKAIKSILDKRID